MVIHGAIDGYSCESVHRAETVLHLFIEATEVMDMAFQPDRQRS